MVTYNEVLQQVQTWQIDDQFQLLQDLQKILSQSIEDNNRYGREDNESRDWSHLGAQELAKDDQDLDDIYDRIYGQLDTPHALPVN